MLLVDPVDDLGDSYASDSWLTVATFHNVDAAHLARIRLEGEGIPCHILNEYTSSTAWHYALATGGVKLQAPRELAAAAMVALRPVEPTPTSADVCAHCGSTEFVAGGWNAKRAFGLCVLALISFGVNPFFGVVMLVCGAVGITRNRQLRCAECGTEGGMSAQRGFEVIAKARDA